MRNITLCVFLLLLSHSCRVANHESEDPYEVSKKYCNCIENQLVNARDSSINLNDCEQSIFSRSRLLSIYADFSNSEKYKKETLDSAHKFAIEVRNITDTLCYNKIDFKKVKKSRHF